MKKKLINKLLVPSPPSSFFPGHYSSSFLSPHCPSFSFLFFPAFPSLRAMFPIFISCLNHHLPFLFRQCFGYLFTYFYNNFLILTFLQVIYQVRPDTSPPRRRISTTCVNLTYLMTPSFWHRCSPTFQAADTQRDQCGGSPSYPSRCTLPTVVNLFEDTTSRSGGFCARLVRCQLCAS